MVYAYVRNVTSGAGSYMQTTIRVVFLSHKINKIVSNVVVEKTLIKQMDVHCAFVNALFRNIV